MSDESIPADLDASIKRLYSTFNRYNSHAPTEGCPHCVCADDIHRIHAKGLHELSAEDLAKYAFKAMTTWGSVDDFKRFLPRIFELVPSDTLFETEVVIGKLDYGRWHTWPKKEREAVHAFLECWWRHALNCSPCCLSRTYCENRIDRTLCSIAQAEDDLAEFLHQWRSDPSPYAAIHLAEYIDHEYHILLKKRHLGNAFWRNRDRQMQQVLDWLLDTASTSHLEHAFFGTDDKSIAELISHAIEELRQVKEFFEQQHRGAKE